MSVLAVYRAFGRLDAPVVARLPAGLSLAEMATRMPDLPREFADRGVICVNNHPVGRALWPLVRPKASAAAPVEVTFHCPPAGGGGDNSGKNVLALVASIALTVATGFVAGGGLATRFGMNAAVWGAGRAGALLLGAGISLGGSLLLSALVPPPAGPQRSRALQNPGTSSADGNRLEPNGPVPRVIGERKVFPVLAGEPLVTFSGPDEIVEAVYVLAGPHRIRDIRIGTAEIGTLPDVEYEVREGFPGDARLSLVTRQSRTDPVQTELRPQTVDATDGVTIETTTGDFTSALPQKMTVGTADAPDEQLLHVIFPAGLNRNADDTKLVRVPFRIRIRPAGDIVWRALPELHFQAATQRQLRATIRLVWTDDATVTPGAAAKEGWVEARVAAPAQSVAPSGIAFAADPYFQNPGDEWLSAANLGTTGVDHVILDRYTAAIYLDRASFPPGRYEIEIQRGTHVLTADWSSPAYTVSGTVYDLFGYYGSTPRIPQTRDGISDQVHLLRSVSVWNAHPLPTDDLAAIAVRARNRQLTSLSCVAGGWVRDWDGGGWRAWTVTDNPAPHLYDIWAGAMNLDPVSDAVIDSAQLVEWRTACAANGWRCNALIEDSSMTEAAQIVAACGYAKPYMAEILGVVRDHDRSAEPPVQIFTPRNSSGFRFDKGFARPPDGLRVNFRDQALDYDARQITVFREGVTDDTGRLEQITYEGLVTEAEVTARARYDQRQTDRRATFYALEAPAEAIVCRRGSLVGVQHDMLTDRAGSARVIEVEKDGAGMVTALVLDAPVPVLAEPSPLATGDMLAVPDVLALGTATGIAIRRAGAAATVHRLTGPSGAAERVVLETPASATGIDTDALVAVGPVGSEIRRLIVWEMVPRADLTFSLTLVDEAPGIMEGLA